MRSQQTSRVKIGIYLGGTGSDGGTYQYALSMLQALQLLPTDRYDVHAFCRTPDWEHRCAALGVPTHSVPAYRVLARAVSWVLRALPQTGLSRTINSRVVPFGRVLKSGGFDACIYPNYEQFAYELDTRSIGIIYDMMHRHEPSFPEVSAGEAAQRRDHILSRTYRGATVTLVDSEIGKQHVIDAYGGTGDSLVVMPYTVPEYIVAAPERDDDVTLADARIAVPSKYLFYPAQYWPHKNHVRLLEALARVKRTSPDVRLVLVGSPKIGHDAVLKAIRELDLDGNVTRLGYVPDEAIPALYRKARALVFACIFGPTGIPPIEAQALGCPVAAPSTYAYPEQLGDGALFFDPWSVDEIAGCIERLWTDDALCAEMAAKGRENVRRLLPDRFAARLAEVIELTLERGL